ncbi:MAG: dethiobiotin synthase [Desulfobacteraceae bacterium]|nr:dethiobiotin synthase [Desulfobacteraceae bacterium]
MDGMDFPDRFFIAGTDTGVGKTVVSAILMAGLQAAYWKPIQSGLEGTTDAEWIQQATGFPDACFYPETYRLSQPISPHAAAAFDGIQIKLDAFELPDRGQSQRLIVEGAGGVMVPINTCQFMTDLIRHLNLPVLLVARSALGTINHTLLSLAQLRREGIDILGVVMNGPRNAINRHAIEAYGRVSIFAELEPIMNMDAHSLQEAHQRYFSPGCCRMGNLENRNPKGPVRGKF